MFDPKLLFGLKLKEFREKQLISQSELALISNLNRAYISDVERGKVNITIENIYKLAESLNVPVKDFFSYNNENIEVDKMSDIVIYYDSLTEAMWFANLNPIFSKADFRIIQSRGKNPLVIEEIIKYDKPDIILIVDNVPRLVLEKTSEVPTGHNVGQRYARLVRAIELGIPTIYFFPYDSRKHGKHSGICNLNVRLLQASLNMTEIHNTPLLTVNWLTEDGELIIDGTEDNELKQILDDYVQSGFNKNCNAFNTLLKHMKEEYKKRIKKRPSYLKLPKSVQEVNTKDFIKDISTNLNISFSDKFASRPKTYIYHIGMKPNACKRQDPYTGTQFIYDYAVCRNGTRVSDKKNNLVLYFPNLTMDTWFKNNPNNPNTKSSNWYLTANALLFKDGIYFNID